MSQGVSNANAVDLNIVDIIVPVYKGLSETQRCIESVLCYLPKNARLIVIDDASPVPEITRFCEDLKNHLQVEVLFNPRNLGFVGSVNRAMGLSDINDVILLNSDTEVHGDWLQRLQKTAYCEETIATVTPFSNNATICSYPVFCAENTLLPGLDLAQTDNIFSHVNANLHVEIPTAVGFCMYIKRTCLNAIGLFDADAFGRGYGEENDFCLRAISGGWSHVLAANVFVYHQGAVSFGADREALMKNAETTIKNLHPHFFDNVNNFISRDPVRTFRKQVDTEIIASRYAAAANALALIRRKEKPAQESNVENMNNMAVPPQKELSFNQALEVFSATTKPRLLFVTHAWGGGVEQHIQDLLALLGQSYSVFIVRGLGAGNFELDLPLSVNSSVPSDRVCLRKHGFNTHNFKSWLNFFTNLNFSRVHLHHVQGWNLEIIDLIQQLNVHYDITLHDYFAISSNYHLIDSKSTSSSPNNATGWPQATKAWQALFLELFAGAERIISPSKGIYEKISKVFPMNTYCIMAHPQRLAKPPQIIKVALLGALSEAKGLALVQQTARLAATEAPHLSFTLIGHSAEPIYAPINVTGSYRNEDFQRLIAEQRPDVIWLPSQVPETFCFTLTNALSTGLPIVASNIGALAERLSGVSQAILLPFDAEPQQWLKALARQTKVPLKQSEEWFENSFDAYRTEYVKPINNNCAKDVKFTLESVKFLNGLSAPTLQKDTPINDLFRIGVYGGHKGSLVEVERRLAILPGNEMAVVGASAFNALTIEQDTAKKDIGFLNNALREADENFLALEQTLAVKENAAEETISLYQNNLDQAEKNIGSLQAQATAAQQHIHHMDKTAEHLTQDKNQLERERNALINSFSWRVTRPMRVAKRALTRTLLTAKRLLRHVTRPASYARAFRLIRVGQWGVLFGRLEYESQAALEQAQVCKSEPPTNVNQDLLTVDALQYEPFTLPVSVAPELSIVIPVYGQHETTYACLKSIADNPPSVPFEVVVMDDCSPTPAADFLSIVAGVKILRNEENLGFVGNMNAGASAAIGDWLVLLNNDTIIIGNAFDKLLDIFSQHENVGLVGAKLLNQDGSLQEAGGIIWRDGSGWNWGRGADRRDPRFNYVRDVDYCSGAVLAIRRELFMTLEGFDTHYAPAYYEDTDLAFRIRAKGLRVLYQPAAEIYHLEGVTHGRDENSGMKAYQKINAKKFYQRWQTTLSSHAENAVQPEREAHRKTRGNILIVEACMITPDEDSGSIRMLNLLQIFKDEGYHVTFVADNLEYREKPVGQMESIGVEVLYNKWAGSVRQVLRKLGPSLDFIFFCRHYIASQYISLARVSAPKAQLVFDTVDLHFVREEREAELENSQELTREAAITKRKELGVVDKSDITLVVSAFEKELLGKLLPNAKVEIVSNIHSLTPHRPNFSARKGILFVGGFRHTPNVDAIFWYAEKVLPYLEKLLPGIVTTVIGSNMPESVAKLHCKALNIRGFVEDITPELASARVSIAPLRYGAGVKGKVNEAMNYGIPVVSTVCGVEGMHLLEGEEVLVADDPQGFAEAIARVYDDENLWQKLSVAGINNVVAHFSPEAALPAVKRILSL